MEMALNNGFCEMTEDEMLLLDGGIDWESIGCGLGILGTTCIAIACAPASAFVGVAYGCMLVGSAAAGAAAGCYIGNGIVN